MIVSLVHLSLWASQNRPLLSFHYLPSFLLGEGGLLGPLEVLERVDGELAATLPDDMRRRIEELQAGLMQV